MFLRSIFKMQFKKVTHVLFDLDGLLLGKILNILHDNNKIDDC